MTVPGAITAPGAYLGAINPPATSENADANPNAKGATDGA